MLAVVYRSFTYVIVLALVGSLALIPRVQKAYVFLSAATWAWILGTLCYYVLPSLGPYAAAPGVQFSMCQRWSSRSAIRWAWSAGTNTSSVTV